MTRRNLIIGKMGKPALIKFDDGDLSTQIGACDLRLMDQCFDLTRLFSCCDIPGGVMSFLLVAGLSARCPTCDAPAGSPKRLARLIYKRVARTY